MIARRTLLVGLPAIGVSASWMHVISASANAAAFTVLSPQKASWQRRTRLSRDALLRLIAEKDNADGDHSPEGEGFEKPEGSNRSAAPGDRDVNRPEATRNAPNQDRLSFDKLFDEKENETYEVLEKSEKILDPARDLDKLMAAFTNLEHLSEFLKRDSFSFYNSSKEAYMTGRPTLAGALRTTEGKWITGMTLGLGAKVIGAYGAQVLAGNLTVGEAAIGLGKVGSGVASGLLIAITLGEYGLFVAAEAQKAGNPSVVHTFEAMGRGAEDLAEKKVQELKATYDQLIPDAY